MNKSLELLFWFSSILSNSSGYIQSKKFVYNLLENEHFYPKKYVNFLLISAVLLSNILYLYDIRHATEAYIHTIEICITSFFVLEYALRFWVASDGHKKIIEYFQDKNETGRKAKFSEALLAPIRQKIRFIIRPLSLIDLISIFPSFAILRIFKLFRYSRGSQNFFAVFMDKKHEVSILAALIAITIFMSSALFYVFEQKNEHIQSFFDAVYWATITISTVGYGDISPLTQEGRILAIILVFSGLGVIAMLTSLVTTGLAQKISELKEQKNIDISMRLTSYILIIGFGDMGVDLCAKLAKRKVPFLIFDKDERAVNEALSLGYNALVIDASRHSDFKEMNVAKKAIDIICLTDSDITNISITLTARSLGYKGRIIARASESRNEDKMRLVGVNSVINHTIGANQAIQYYNSPVLYKIANALIYEGHDVSIEEIVAPVSTKTSVNDLDLEGLGCVLLGVFRADENDSFIFNPPSCEFEIFAGDTMVVYGKTRRIEGLRKCIEQECAK